MSEYLLVLGLTTIWLASLLGAYACGRSHGHQAAQEEMKWGRWLLRRHQNRSTRI